MSGLDVIGKGHGHKAIHNFGLHVSEPFQSYGYTAGCGCPIKLKRTPAGDGQGFGMSFPGFWGS